MAEHAIGGNATKTRGLNGRLLGPLAFRLAGCQSLLMSQLPFLSQASQASSAQGPEGAIAPFTGVTQGGAPGGLTFASDLPVGDSSTPANLNGYTANGGQAPLPPPGSTQGDGLPPSGRRR